jgi:hypothetical protein
MTQWMIGGALAAGMMCAVPASAEVTFDKDVLPILQHSRANKWNPDPTAAVRWGNQSWQEMLSAPMGVIVDRTVDPKTVIEAGGFPGVAGAQ